MEGEAEGPSKMVYTVHDPHSTSRSLAQSIPLTAEGKQQLLTTPSLSSPLRYSIGCGLGACRALKYKQHVPIPGAALEGDACEWLGIRRELKADAETRLGSAPPSHL